MLLYARQEFDRYRGMEHSSIHAALNGSSKDLSKVNRSTRTSKFGIDERRVAPTMIFPPVVMCRLISITEVSPNFDKGKW